MANELIRREDQIDVRDRLDPPLGADHPHVEGFAELRDPPADVPEPKQEDSAAVQLAALDPIPVMGLLVLPPLLQPLDVVQHGGQDALRDGDGMYPRGVGEQHVAAEDLGGDVVTEARAA